MHVFYIVMALLLVGLAGKALQRLRGAAMPFSPIFGWLLGLLLIAILPLALLAFNGGYTIPELYDVQSSYASVNLRDGSMLGPYLLVWFTLAAASATTLLVSYAQPASRGGSGMKVEEGPLRRILFATMVLATLDFALNIELVGGLQAFLGSHWYVREVQLIQRYGSAFVLLTHVEQANQALFLAAAILHAYWQIQQRKWRLGVTGVTVLFLVAQMVMSGNRIFIAIYVAALGASLWFNRRMRALVALLLVLPLVLVVFSAWAFLRHDLSSIAQDLPAFLHLQFRDRTMTTLMDSTEGADAMLLLHVVQDFGTNTPYLDGATYGRVFTFFLPHRLDPDQPTGLATKLADLYLPGVITSLNATEVGELYANFGPFCLGLAPLLTAALFFWSSKLEERTQGDALTPVVGFVCAVWCARSSLEDALTLFLLAWLMLRAYGLLFHRRLPAATAAGGEAVLAGRSEGGG